MKTFIFKHIDKDTIRISIEAPSFEEAYYILIDTTKHTSDFIQHLNNQS